MVEIRMIFSNNLYDFETRVTAFLFSIYKTNLSKFTVFSIIFFLVGCGPLPRITEDNNRLSVAQKKILNRDYDGARTILSNIYEKSNLKTEKGEALYWIAYTHIKESSYKEARNFLETADKLYRNGPLLGAISARIIACALLENDEARALKQYEWIQDKRVGEKAEIDFIMGRYFQKKGDRSQTKLYFQRCAASGDNFFSRKASSFLQEVKEGTYYLQVGRFANLNSVKNLMAKLNNEYNLDAYIKETKANDSKLYIICIGKFSSFEEAEKELKMIKGRYSDLDLIVKP